MGEHAYLCIDLKSFYASVECIERGLDPMTTNLVVADASRTAKTICLAVSPALKEMCGVPGRARLFEVEQAVSRVNSERLTAAPNRTFCGESHDRGELLRDPSKKLSYLIAPPRMAHYMQHSTQIYQVYLQFVSPQDIHVYSIDEVFIDLTQYLSTYDMTAKELTKRIIQEVLRVSGITATAGIGTNLYLAKIAMDIVAKHIPPDENGVRIAELTEESYRRTLWDHRPLHDFWRVGRGYEKKLMEHGLYTMGDIARCSVGKASDYYNEELLYRLFGVNAELLIDHAWGYEPCTIAQVKSYRPQNNSLGAGQVLHCAYESDKARLIVHEMIDQLVLELVDKGLVTDQIVLTVGYDIENLTDPNRRMLYHGEITTDAYGRRVPKHAHGTANLPQYTSSTKQISEAVLHLYDRIIEGELLVRRINLSANHVITEREAHERDAVEQLDLFTDYEALEQKRQKELRERKMQEAVIGIKKKFGKNAILKGMNLQEGATMMDRNRQIGGHKA